MLRNPKLVRLLEDQVGQIIMTAVLQGLQIGTIEDPARRLGQTDDLVKRAQSEVKKLTLDIIEIEILRKLEEREDAVVQST